MAMMGKQMGVNASKFVKDFNASLSHLAVYGDSAVNVFQGLAGAAAAAGVEVSTLLNLANKFDTFEGAATSVGKLNAIMGTQLNATDMLLQTEDQRIETLIQTVQGTGKAFKDMDRFTQKAIMQAAGINDVNEAQKIFGMNLGQYKEFSKEQDIAQKQQEKLNEAMRNATKVTDKLKFMFAELVINLGPFVDDVSKAVTAVHQFVVENRAIIGPIAKVIMGIAALVVVIKTFMFLASFLSFGLLPGLIGGLFGVAPAGAAAGGGATAAATGISAAIATITTAVSTAIGALATAVSTALGGFVTALGGIATGAAAAMPVIVPLVLVIIGLAAAAFMVGAGIMMAATGMAIFVGALIYAVTSGAMGQILAGMMALQVTAITLAFVGTAAALGIGLMAIAIGGLALALYALPTSGLTALAEFAKGMSEIESKNVEASFAAASSFVADLNTNSDTVKPMLQNMALMTTGVSAESGALGMLGAAIVGVGKKVEDASKNQGKEMVVKLEGEDLRKFIRGEAVRVNVGTNY